MNDIYITLTATEYDGQDIILTLENAIEQADLSKNFINHNKINDRQKILELTNDDIKIHFFYTPWQFIDYGQNPCGDADSRPYFEISHGFDAFGKYECDRPIYFHNRQEDVNDVIEWVLQKIEEYKKNQLNK